MDGPIDLGSNVAALRVMAPMVSMVAMGAMPFTVLPVHAKKSSARFDWFPRLFACQNLWPHGLSLAFSLLIQSQELNHWQD